jgi:hypothetical protein
MNHNTSEVLEYSPNRIAYRRFYASNRKLHAKKHFRAMRLGSSLESLGAPQQHFCVRTNPQDDVARSLLPTNKINGLSNDHRSDVGVACFAGFGVFRLLK